MKHIQIVFILKPKNAAPCFGDMHNISRFYFIVVRMMLQISTYKYKEIIHFFGPEDTIFSGKTQMCCGGL